VVCANKCQKKIGTIATSTLHGSVEMRYYVVKLKGPDLKANAGFTLQNGGKRVLGVIHCHVSLLEMASIPV
jgi:hypothetical protein